VRDGNTLRNHVADSAPGSTAPLVVMRDGKERTLSVKLDEKPGSEVTSSRGGAEPADKAALGISVAPLTPELAARMRLPRSAKGLVVQGVDPDGRAAEAGLQEGDVIAQVNQQSVQNVDELRAAVRRSADRPVLLLVTRGERTVFVTVKPS
jgi:serine protease Do